jgi:hypothetical protein
MEDRSKVTPVASGSEYTVASVNGRPPSCLDDFAAADVVKIVVDGHAQVVTVRGAARCDGDVVVVNEKDHDGTGKDVRVWSVSTRDGTWYAVPS